VLLFDAFKNGTRESLPQDPHKFLVGGDRELLRGDAHKLAIDAISEAAVGLPVDVCSLLFGAPIQQFAKGGGYSDSFHRFPPRLQSLAEPPG